MSILNPRFFCAGCCLAFLIFSTSVFAQQTATIQGKVINNINQPLAGVNLNLQGTGFGAASDNKGHFAISGIPPGAYTFVASSVGYKSEQKNIVLKTGQVLQIEVKLSKSNQELQEIIVKANHINKFTNETSDYVSKMPLKQMENPQVYSSIPEQLLTDQMAYSIEDALKNATGLQKMWGATGRSGDGGAYYNSRGFILQSQLRNGVAGNITSRIDAVNLEKVEVIKGPSATLFGSTLTSYGGLINRVTKKPYDNFGGNVTFSAGNYDFNRLSVDFNTPLDATKKVLLRVNTAYNYKGSFQDNAFDKYYVFDPSLTYEVNDRLTFSLDAELYSGQNLNTSIYFPFISSVSSLGVNRADELPIDYRRTFASGDLAQDSRNSNYFGKVAYKISDQWNTQTNVTVTHSYSDGPNPYFYLLSNGEVTGNPDDIGADYISRDDQLTRNSNDGMMEFQQNINGTFKLGSLKNRFVGGIDLFHHNAAQFFAGATFDTVASHGSVPTYRDFNKINLDAVYMNRGVSFIYPINFVSNTYSTYALDVLNVTDNLTAMAALRVDHFVNNGAFDASTGTTSGGYHQTAFSPKFGLVYQLIPDQVSLFGNYQNGFTNQNGVNFQGHVFKPEHANQWEGGIKLNLFEGRLSSTVSYYDIQVEDVVRPDPDHINFSIQNGTQSSRGVEADVTASPVAGLNIKAGFSYNDSKYEQASADVVGRRPITAMSPYRANFWLSYRVPDAFLEGFGLGFGGNYAGDNKIVNSKSLGVFILPAYTILNTSVFYDCSKFRFSLKVDNLMNKHYWTGYDTINPQELRSITGSISFKF